MDGQEESFWTFGLTTAVVIGVVLLVFVGLGSALVLDYETCGGDGGLPYAAPASPRGEFCDNGGALAPLWAPLVAVALGTVAAHVFRHRIYLVIAILAALFLAIAPHLVANTLSIECSDDDPAVPNEQEFGSSVACDHF